MNQQFIYIELGLTVGSFIWVAIITVIWILGLITIGMGIERRWGR